jgi:Holliday junction resolvase RusA-like endonuclease
MTKSDLEQLQPAGFAVLGNAIISPDGRVLKRFKTIDKAEEWYTSWQFDYYQKEIVLAKEFIDSCRELSVKIDIEVEVQLYQGARERAGL